MFDQVSEEGEEAFVDWFAALFSEGAETVTFPVSNRSSIRLLAE